LILNLQKFPELFGTRLPPPRIYALNPTLRSIKPLSLAPGQFIVGIPPPSDFFRLSLTALPVFFPTPFFPLQGGTIHSPRGVFRNERPLPQSPSLHSFPRSVPSVFWIPFPLAPRLPKVESANINPYTFWQANAPSLFGPRLEAVPPPLASFLPPSPQSRSFRYPAFLIVHQPYRGTGFRASWIRP